MCLAEEEETVGGSVGCGGRCVAIGLGNLIVLVSLGGEMGNGEGMLLLLLLGRGRGNTSGIGARGGGGGSDGIGLLLVLSRVEYACDGAEGVWGDRGGRSAELGCGGGICDHCEECSGIG